MKAQWFNAVDQIGEATWQEAIGTTRYPFAQFAFHQALEQSKSIGDGTGWYPEYLLVMDDDDHPLAIAPTYLKTHSQGEFVFDWSWADAYQRYGMRYFPKRIWAIPFSPVTGVRLFSHLDPNGDDVAFLDFVQGARRFNFASPMTQPNVLTNIGAFLNDIDSVKQKTQGSHGRREVRWRRRGKRALALGK